MKKIIIVFLFLLVSILTINTSKANNNKNDYKKYLEKYNKSLIRDNNPYIDPIYGLVPGYKIEVIDIDRTLKEPSKKYYKYFYPETIKSVKRLPIYKLHPKSNYVTFIINVSWGEEYINDMLNIFKEKNIYCNFFVEGNWVLNNTLIFQEILSNKHTIGSHSLKHQNFSLINEESQKVDIIKTNNIIMYNSTKKVRFFGPPSGSYNNDTVELMEKLNMFMFLWTLDTIDWKSDSKNEIVNRINSKVKSGDIILMHPTKYTVEALPEIIEKINNKGLSIKSLDEIIY